MTLSILVTIDTETYSNGCPDQQIFGKASDGGEYGIRWIMDVLERHGARGTFYVNAYEAERSGEDILKNVIREIHSRGHDVELHSHPRDRYGIDKIARANTSRQREILAWGKAFIERETGTEIVAHRAGSFSANLDTISALRDLGIKVDASLSPAWYESDIAREVGTNNEPFMLNGILELPVTYYLQINIMPTRSIRMADIEGSSLQELKSITRQALAAKVSAINILMHSHSFMHNGHPRRAILKRLELLLQFLDRQPEVRISTTRDFLIRWDSGKCSGAEATRFIPYTGWWLTYLRAVESVGDGWKNVVLALSPIVLLVLIVGLVHWMM